MVRCSTPGHLERVVAQAQEQAEELGWAQVVVLELGQAQGQDWVRVRERDWAQVQERGREGLGGWVGGREAQFLPGKEVMLIASSLWLASRC